MNQFAVVTQNTNGSFSFVSRTARTVGHNVDQAAMFDTADAAQSWVNSKRVCASVVFVQGRMDGRMEVRQGETVWAVV